MDRQNKYRVIVSERAANMLVSHAAFLAQVSPIAAERLVGSFENAAGSLDTMPHKWPWLNGDYLPQNKYHKMLIEKRYLLICQIKDDTVYVDYVMDCRQDYTWLIE